VIAKHFGNKATQPIKEAGAMPIIHDP